MWLAFAGFPTWGEAFTTTTDDWIRAGLWALLIVCIIFLSVGLIRMFCSSRGGAAKTTEPPELPKHDETVVPEELAEPGEDDFRSFDVEIRDAVNHLVETSAHTFNSSGEPSVKLSERFTKRCAPTNYPSSGCKVISMRLSASALANAENLNRERLSSRQIPHRIMEYSSRSLTKNRSRLRL